MLPPSLNSKRAGFSLIEVVIATAIFGILLGLFASVFGSSLDVKKRETLMLELQQNLRNSLQLIAQDLRSGTLLHVWHSSTCTVNNACSNASQISIVTTEGTLTSLAEPPGNSFNNSAVTGVCDARGFKSGDVAMLYNGSQVELFEVSGKQLHADYSKPCSGTPNPNRDKVQHNKYKLSGQWSTSAYLYKTVLATYTLRPDPIDASRQVLYRQTGLNQVGDQTGIVSFDFDKLEFDYGVPVNPSDPASKLIFYPTLEQAATALGSSYSAYPGGSKTYVGSLLGAIRVSLTGKTSHPLPKSNQYGTFTLTETVEMRR